MRKWDRFSEWVVSIFFCLVTIYQMVNLYPVIFCNQSEGMNWWFKFFILACTSFGTAVIITFIFILIFIVLFCMWIGYKIIREINKSKKKKDEN